MWIKILLPLLVTHSLWAACPSLDIQNLVTSYDFQNDLTPRFGFRVTRAARSEYCHYAIGIDRGASPTYQRKISSGSDDLNYNLARNASHNTTLKDVNDWLNDNEIIQGRFKNNAGPLSFNEKFFGKLFLPNNPTAGFYSDTVNVKIYELVGQDYVLRQSKPLTLFYNVPEVIALSITPRGGAFDPNSTSQVLNFGNLTQGQTKGVDVVIQTCAGYKLNISSLNNGKLKHQQANFFANYSLTANSNPINLTNSSMGPVTISTASGSHPSDGFRFELDFQINDISNLPAGNYQDILTVTVTTNL